MEHSGIKTHYFSCTVVRKLSTGRLEFHRYRRVRNSPATMQRFLDKMQDYNSQRGRALYVNFYDKETRLYSHRYVF